MQNFSYWHWISSTVFLWWGWWWNSVIGETLPSRLLLNMKLPVSLHKTLYLHSTCTDNKREYATNFQVKERINILGHIPLEHPSAVPNFFPHPFSFRRPKQMGLWNSSSVLSSVTPSCCICCCCCHRLRPHCFLHFYRNEWSRSKRMDEITKSFWNNNIPFRISLYDHPPTARSKHEYSRGGSGQVVLY